MQTEKEGQLVLIEFQNIRTNTGITLICKKKKLQDTFLSASFDAVLFKVNIYAGL